MSNIITLEELSGEKAREGLIERIMQSEDGHGKIGTETELLLFDPSRLDGFPAYAQIERIFDGLIANLGSQGHKIDRKNPDDVTHGIKYSLDGKSGEISLDVSTGQFEISGSALDNVHGTHQENLGLTGMIKKLSDQEGITVLGLGLRPGLQEIPRSLEGVVNKPERYRRVFVERYGQTLAYNAVNNSFQVNLGLAPDNAVRALKLFLRASPTLVSLFANSPFKGYAAYRERCWHELKVDPKYADNDDHSSRIGLPIKLLQISEDVDGLREYLKHIFSVSPFLTVYNGSTLHIPELTGQELVNFKDDLHGNKDGLLDKSFAYTVGTYWPVARLKFDPLRVEIRCADLQPSVEGNTSIAAFSRGLLYNIDKALSYLSQFSDEAIIDAYNLAVQYGSNGVHVNANQQKVPNSEIVSNLWGIAKEGLQLREPIALQYLDRSDFSSPALLLPSLDGIRIKNIGRYELT